MTSPTQTKEPARVIYPPALRPGDVIAVVAPASPFEPVLAWVALGWLAKRYRLRFTRGIFAKKGYLAGSDERRREEMARALAAPDVRAILAARGGYGVPRFGHTLDWAAFAAHPRWLIGFSDITALHVEATRVGVASIHGPNLTWYGRGDMAARDAFIRTVESPAAERVYPGLRVLRGGAAEGPLFGGNLTMLHAAAAAGRLAIPDGAILLLEDVTERPYRIDRMLSTLEAGGHLARVSAVALGEFTQCDPGPDGVTVGEVLETLLGRLGVPIVAGLPIGHGTRNDPVVLGSTARVLASSGEGTLSLHPPPASLQ